MHKILFPLLGVTLSVLLGSTTLLAQNNPAFNWQLSPEQIALTARKVTEIESKITDLENELLRRNLKGVAARIYLEHLAQTQDPNLQNAIVDVKNLYRELDDLQAESLLWTTRYVIMATELILRRVYVDLDAKSRQQKEIDEAYDLARIGKNIYESVEGLFGTPKDNQRTQAFRNYIQNALAFFELAQHSQNSKLINARNSMKGLIDRVKQYSRFLPLAFNISDVVGVYRYAKPKDTRKHIQLRDGIQHTPAVNHVFNITKALGYAFGVDEYKPIGNKKLDFKRTENTVYIVTPTHFSRFQDQGAIGATILRDFVIMLNFKIGPIAEMVPRHEAVIAVGSARLANSVSEDPVDKILRLADEKKLQAATVYAQGQTPQGLGEIMPIRDGFVQKIIPGLIERGFKIVIVPMIFADHRFLFSEAVQVPKSRIIISDPIDPVLTAELAKSSDGRDLLGLLIKQIFVDEMESALRKSHQAQQDPAADLVAGQTRFNPLKARIHDRFIKSLGPNFSSCLEILKNQ